MKTNKLVLIEQIYDAVSNPKGWNYFLDNLVQEMGGHAARIRMSGSNDGYQVIAGTGHDKSYDKSYQDYYGKLDLWNPILERHGAGELFDSHRIVPDKVFRRSEIYNDFYRDYDMYFGIGGHIIKTDTLTARIGIHRPRSRGPFADIEKALLKSLMPHLKRAFELGSHIHALESKKAAMQEALYRSRDPLILIDEFGEVVFLNERAEGIVRDRAELSIRQNHLTLMRASEQSQLQQLMQQAIKTGARKGTGSGGSMSITPKRGKKILNLVITPYPARSVSYLGTNTRICAAVFIHNPASNTALNASLLKTLYALTPAEIRLAEALVDGKTQAEAAAEFGVSINTTRTQLRNLFAKTETQRQPELVSLLLRLGSAK